MMEYINESRVYAFITNTLLFILGIVVTLGFKMLPWTKEGIFGIVFLAGFFGWIGFCMGISLFMVEDDD